LFQRRSFLFQLIALQLHC